MYDTEKKLAFSYSLSYQKKIVINEQLNEKKLMQYVWGCGYPSLFKLNCEKHNVSLDNNFMLYMKLNSHILNAKTDYFKNLKELNEQMRNIGIAPIFMKGSNYVLDNYISVQHRIQGDIDIFVDSTDAALKAYEALSSNGYQPREQIDDILQHTIRFRQHLPTLYKENHYPVEIHHCLFSGEADIGKVLTEGAYTETKCISGDEYLIPVREMAFVMACHHLFRHEYCEGTYCAKTMVDIFNFLRYTDMDWNKVLGIVINSKFEYGFAYCIHYFLVMADYIDATVVLPLIITDIAGRYGDYNAIYDKYLPNDDYKESWDETMFPYYDRIFYGNLYENAKISKNPEAYYFAKIKNILSKHKVM